MVHCFKYNFHEMSRPQYQHEIIPEFINMYLQENSSKISYQNKSNTEKQFSLETGKFNYLLFTYYILMA